MDNLLYVSMSGASQILDAQTINSNNLANLSTTGFRADLDNFNSLYVSGEGLDTRVYPQVNAPVTDFTPGALISTGRKLDVAIKGDGFMSMLNDNGEEVMTRAGDLQINEQGLLTNARNQPILGESGPITVGAVSEIEIGIDGSVSIVPEGANSTNLVFIDRIKLSNPDITNMTKNTQGHLVTKDGTIPESSSEVMLTSGFLEGSNVNAVESMTKIISLARDYEIQLKMMQTAEQLSETEASMMQL